MTTSLHPLPTRPFPSRCLIAVLATIVLQAVALPPNASAQAGYQGSRWLSQVEYIDAMLGNGKWKRAQKTLRLLVPEVLRTSWHEPDLDRVLGRLALQYAIAAANLGEQDTALWYWHTAQNIDPETQDEDLSSYGKAAALLHAHPLRRHGVVPSGRDVKRSPFFATGVTPPRARPQKNTPPVLRNSAAKDQYIAPLRIELIITADGHLEQPVVEDHSRHHPAVLFGGLEAIRTWSYDAATQDDKPVDCLYEIELSLNERSRW